MGDLICCIAGDRLMSPYINGLCENLVNESDIESHFEEDAFDFEQRVAGNISPIILCIIHAPPTERDISAALKDNIISKCIIIQVSGHATLKICSEFNDKLACFFWPNNHAEGIELLGKALNSKFGQLSQWTVDAESVRKFIEQYFLDHFEVEHLIAAYLLNKHYYGSATDMKKSLKEAGVSKEVADLSLDDIETKLKSHPASHGF